MVWTAGVGVDGGVFMGGVEGGVLWVVWREGFDGWCGGRWLVGGDGGRGLMGGVDGGVDGWCGGRGLMGGVEGGG